MRGGSFGGMGGGNMLRAVGRAVRPGGVAGGGFPESFSTSTATTPTSPRSATSSNSNNSNGNANPTNNLSISSVSAPSSPPCNKKPLPGGGAGGGLWPSFACEDYEMVAPWDGNWSEDENSARNYYLDEFVLGPVPSVDEVHNAVSALQQAFDCNANPPLVRDRFGPAVDKGISEPDWIEPAIHFSNPTALQTYGCNRVYDAFHMLQNDPAIQRMVVSLSSDKAVWDAVLNNEVVKQLKETLCDDAGETESIPSEVSQEDESSSNSNTVVDIIKHLFDDTKEKFMVVVDQLTKLVTDLFQPPPNVEEETTTPLNDSFEEKLRKSFMISVVVLLIVVVTRAQSA